MSAVPTEVEGHLESVQQSPGFADLSAEFARSEFKMVELGKLLAYQFHVEVDRANMLAASLTPQATAIDLARLCLPAEQERYVPQVTEVPGGVVIHSSSLNLRVVRQGAFVVDHNADSADRVMGVWVGMGCPLMHVAEFEGKVYLRNGFHRAYALLRAGIEQAPCLVVSARHQRDIGPLRLGETFLPEHFASARPPTMAHFRDDRAYAVQLRKLSRVVTCSWTETVIEEG